MFKTNALFTTILIGVGAMLAGGSSSSAALASVQRQPAAAASGTRPLLIEHGFDVDTAASVGRHAAQIDALPFDGVSIQPAQNPCSATPVSLATAQADVGAMPKLNNVTHNFILCRLLDDAAPGSATNPYDVNNDAMWATISNNLSIYAQAARATGRFDGFMIDTEYYGQGPNPWDYDTINIPWTYPSSGSRPFTLPAAAQAAAQHRGKQTMDAMRAGWPEVVAFHLRGGELSDPASFKVGNMAGYDVAWANELAGPFFVGAVESAMGTAASVVDGGESYHQRTLSDFQDTYSWLRTRFGNSGGQIVPSGAVTAAGYNATISVASQVFDKDITRPGRPTFSSNQLQVLLSYAQQATDKYRWFFSETFDWRGSGWPSTPVPQAYIDAVRQSRSSSTNPSATGTLLPRPPARLVDSRSSGKTIDGAQQAGGLVPSHQTYEVQVAGRASIPTDADAAALTFTITSPAAAGFLTVWPCGTPVPETSISNFVAGQDVAASLLIGLGSGGKVCASSSVSTHLIVDVAGHEPAGSSYVGVTPARLLDTRSPNGTIDNQQSGAGAVLAGSSTRVNVLGRGGLPADATAAYLTVTIVGLKDAGFVTLYRCGQPIPVVSTANVVAGHDVANATIIRLTADGVCIYSSASAHLILDVTGYENVSSVVRTEINTRAWDTRNTPSRLSGSNLRIPLPLGPVGHVALNATVVNPSAGGFVTVYPVGPGESCNQPPPNASTVNFSKGQTVADLVFSRATSDSSGTFVCAYSSVATDFLLDVVAYAP